VLVVRSSRDSSPNEARPHAMSEVDRSSVVAASDTVEIGRIARAHGVRGELRVALHWPDSDTLLASPEVLVQAPGAEPRMMRVERARRADRAILLTLAGIGDRDAASALRGASVQVRRDSLPAAAAGEFYLCDLIGARVVEPGGEVGVVVEIKSHPSVDCLVIRTPQGSLVEQPLVLPWFERVDLAARCVHLSGRDGLIE
jgi:16S rRNA processing protein RimM